MFEFQGRKIIKKTNGEYLELIGQKDAMNKGKDKLIESDIRGGALKCGKQSQIICMKLTKNK